jgi:putative transcriptional regulator
MPKKLKLHLKEIMAERGITQMELSEMTGIQQSTISRWVRSYLESVHLETLQKICHALDVSVEDIIVEVEEGESVAAA